jgi:alpha-glucosidase
VFDWILIETEWSAAAFRAAIAVREAAWSDRWPVTVLSNHDRSRHVSRYLETLGRHDAETADAVAKASATLALTTRGSPFLYYGEEIGALDINVPRDQAQDRAAAQMDDWWNRDGCRAPMSWSDGPQAGFTDGTPWLPIASDVASRNVVRQRASEDSVLAHYRRLLTLRRGSAPLHSGSLELVDVADPGALAYLRRAGDDTMLVVVRFDQRSGEVELPPSPTPWRIVLSSHDRETPTVGSRVRLRPLEAVVLQPVADTMGG